MCLHRTIRVTYWVGGVAGPVGSTRTAFVGNESRLVMLGWLETVASSGESVGRLLRNRGFRPVSAVFSSISGRLKSGGRISYEATVLSLHEQTYTNGFCEPLRRRPRISPSPRRLRVDVRAKARGAAPSVESERKSAFSLPHEDP